MRIAFAGSFDVGKSTLIESVADRLPAYAVIDEPYASLEEDGYPFADPPTREDFEAQLECSLDLIAASPTQALLDRSPLDLFALGAAFGDPLDLEAWRERLTGVLPLLDGIVYVPIETRDRIVTLDGDWPRERRLADDALRDLLDGAGQDIAGPVPILEVRGSVRARTDAVLEWIRSRV